MGTQAPPPPLRPKSAFPARTPSFLDRLVALFASDDPEKVKQRQLREIAADLRGSRARFYSPSRGTMEPSLARFFFEIWRTFSGAQVLLSGPGVSGALKLAVVELSFSEEQRGLRERLGEKSIDERSRQAVDPEALRAEVRRDVHAFQDSIDPEWAEDRDAVYGQLLVLRDLVAFDYVFLLRKFFPELSEQNVSAPPRFAPIAAREAVDELADFLEILPSVDPDADWERVLAVLHEHRGVEAVGRDPLRRTLQSLREVQRSGVLLMIVRHVLQNPGWKPMVRSHRERIVEPYVAKVKSEAEAALQKVAQGRHNEKLEELARSVFGSAAVTRLANYSQGSNAAFSQKLLGGFLHVTALNYLRAFLLDYLAQGIREVVDLLIIRGRWADPRPSQQLSGAFHELLTVNEAISQFDATLSEDGDLGRRLRTIAMRVDRDRKAVVQLRAALQQVNDQANGMIGEAMRHFVAMGRVMKLVHDDVALPRPAVLLNSRDLRPGPGRDLRGLIAGVYRKIYGFVQLMQMYRK